MWCRSWQLRFSVHRTPSARCSESGKIISVLAASWSGKHTLNDGPLKCSPRRTFQCCSTRTERSPAIRSFQDSKCRSTHGLTASSDPQHSPHQQSYDGVVFGRVESGGPANPEMAGPDALLPGVRDAESLADNP